MKEHKEIRKEVSGPEAAPYMGLARKILGDMKQQMQLGELKQLKWVKTLKDGTQILVQSVFGQDKVAIFVPVKGGKKVRRQERIVEINDVIYYWHNGTGIYRLEDRKPVELILTSAEVTGKTLLGTSPDGSHIFGGGGWYWSKASGYVDVPEMAVIYDSASDGEVFVGVDASFNSALFTKTKGVEIIDEGTSRYAISADGDVVLLAEDGGGLTEDVNAKLWTRATGSVVVARFDATGISADGRVVFGWKTKKVSALVYKYRGAYWTKQKGTVLIEPPSGFGGLQFFAASEDGSVLAGVAVDNPRIVTMIVPVVWTEATGVIRLDSATGATESRASDITADGAIVVGTYGSDGGYKPFKWSTTTGRQPLFDTAVFIGKVFVGSPTLKLKTTTEEQE